MALLSATRYRCEMIYLYTSSERDAAKCLTTSSRRTATIHAAAQFDGPFACCWAFAEFRKNCLETQDPFHKMTLYTSGLRVWEKERNPLRFSWILSLMSSIWGTRNVICCPSSISIWVRLLQPTLFLRKKINPQETCNIVSFFFLSVWMPVEWCGHTVSDSQVSLTLLLYNFWECRFGSCFPSYYDNNADALILKGPGERCRKSLAIDVNNCRDVRRGNALDCKNNTKQRENWR